MGRKNFDRIKDMGIEELAEFLLEVNDACYLPCKIIDGKCKYFPENDKGCKDCFKEWLEREVEE